MPIVEVRVRRFLTSDEADVAPQAAILLDVPIERIVLNEKPIEHLAALCGAQLDKIPLTNLREMTREEVDEYLKENEE